MITNPKPYDLVLVDAGDYKYIGQIISRPTPENTIMVRRVPDDPSTMIEVPLTKLSKPISKKKYVQYAVIVGNLGFPVDMLRYDSATPVNFSIVEKEEYGPISVKLKEGETQLIIGRATELKGQQWTTGRWNSFGWYIKPLKTLKIEGK